MTRNKATKSAYHHGDLKATLLSAAAQMLEETGVEGLSLRKLAEKVGVSRTAPYHHFKDKNELLCAIAASGFSHWHQTAIDIFSRESVPPMQRYREFVRAYIGYAADNPELYDLMFGRTIWKPQSATEALRNEAFPSFQFQVKMTREWQAMGLLPKTEDALRLAQVTWGTLHGIARLLIDGIYADHSHIDEMCECAVNLFMSQANTQ